MKLPFAYSAAFEALGSLPPFAAFAQQKKRADALSVRFLRAALWTSHLQRMSAIRSSMQYVCCAASRRMGSNQTFAV
jgi:hypothetical protein